MPATTTRLATLYKDRRNRVTASVKTRQYGVETAADWSAITRMVLVILSSPAVVIDSDDTPTAIDWSTNGEVTFDIGEAAGVVALNAGDYYLRLTAFDGAGEDKEVFSDGHERTPVVLPIRDTSTLA